MCNLDNDQNTPYDADERIVLLFCSHLQTEHFLHLENGLLPAWRERWEITLDTLKSKLEKAWTAQKLQYMDMVSQTTVYYAKF